LRLRRHRGDLLACGRRLRPAILHSHFGMIGWENLRVARCLAARHVVTFYGIDVGFYPRHDSRWLGRYHTMFAEVDRVLCEGPHMRRAVVALGCPEERVTVHHLGVELDAIPLRPRIWDGRSPLRVLIAAAFREKKGIPFALEALGRLRETTPLHITLVGETPPRASSAERQRILAAIDRWRLHDVVRRLGFLPHRELLREAYEHHLFLSPSVTAADGDTEGGAPVSLIEMAASGMVVVSTRHCDIPEVVIDDATGFLAPERDIDGLVTCLRKAVERRHQWPAMQRAARTHLQNGFDAMVQGRKLAALYLNLLGADECPVQEHPPAGVIA